MANIMSMVKLKNKTSRNGFDLSRKNAFTAKVGELLPVVCMEMLPGDSADLEIQHFTRTRPVNTAAYTRIREYFDWFFVPTNLMWNKFNTVFSQMYDDAQHAQGLRENKSLYPLIPYTDTDKIGDYIQSMKGKLNMYGYDRSNLTSKLLSYLGYGDLSFNSNDNYTDANSTLKNLSVNLFPLLAYQKIYSDYYRNSQWEKSAPNTFNLDYLNGTTINQLQIPVDELTENYSTEENLFDLRYRNWNKDLFMGVLPDAQYGGAASVQSTTLSPIGSVSPFERQMNVSYDYSSTAVQTDSITGIFTPSGGTAKGYLRPTNQNSPLKFNLSEDDVRQLRRTLGFGVDDYIVISNAFSILQLRYAEAQQMWKEITQSQQQDFKSQIEAHWNVSLSDSYSERCKYIGGSVSNLDISEVVNTNITADNEASVAGKGVGVGQSREKFKTDIPGYLICIYSAVPLLDYSISGVKRMCTRIAATDFAIPEFDAVGMESLGLEQLINTVFQTRVPSSLELIQNLGYVPRYIDYKTAYDEINGAFRKQSDGLNDWVAPLTNQYFEDYLANLANSGVSASGSLTYQFFKVNPNILDPIFDVNADSSVSSDQLWINANFDIKAVRNLDRNGLPY